MKHLELWVEIVLVAGAIKALAEDPGMAVVVMVAAAVVTAIRAAGIAAGNRVWGNHAKTAQ